MFWWLVNFSYCYTLLSCLSELWGGDWQCDWRRVCVRCCGGLLWCLHQRVPSGARVSVVAALPGVGDPCLSQHVCGQCAGRSIWDPSVEHRGPAPRSGVHRERHPGDTRATLATYDWPSGSGGCNKAGFTRVNHHFDGLVQERRNSSALEMELRLSCSNPSS